jgi:hypothetical protein
MDRSKATHKREPCSNQKILLAEHNLPVWGTQKHNSGQREVLWQHNVQRILPVDWHEGWLRISISPTIKWSSQKSKLFNF